MTLIGFDFDRVLFQTDEFKNFLDEEFPGFLESYPSGTYTPGSHAESMGVDVEEIYDALENADRFLNPNVEVLEKLDGFEIIIVTRGDPRFQRRKIEHSGVLKYVNGMEIVEEGSKGKTGVDFLVDDLENEIDDADVPGIVFDQGEDTLEEAVERIKAHFS